MSHNTLESDIFVTALPLSGFECPGSHSLNQTFNQLQMLVSQACARSWR